MICLDTNYLIRGVMEGTFEANALISWGASGEELMTPMPAWFEFICGPVTDAQINALNVILTRIVPFDAAEAVEAARLFNAANRKRALRVDAMIAGTAIAAGARLATRNRIDFEPFLEYGLKLA